jgi:hypothetical protein
MAVVAGMRVRLEDGQVGLVKAATPARAPRGVPRVLWLQLEDGAELIRPSLGVVPWRRGDQTRLEPDVELRVAEIVHAWARLLPGGRHPVRCVPAQAEVKGRRLCGEASDGKAIYDTWFRADAAGWRLTRLLGREHRPFKCPRSRRGHWHLTTRERVAHAGARVHDR